MNDVDKVVFSLDVNTQILLQKEGRVLAKIVFENNFIQYKLSPATDFLARITDDVNRPDLSQNYVSFYKNSIKTVIGNGVGVVALANYRVNPDLMKQVIDFLAKNDEIDLDDILVAQSEDNNEKTSTIEFTESGTKKADIAKKGVSLVEKQTFGKTDAAMKLPEEVVRDKINRYIGGRKRKTRRTTKRR